MCTLSVSNVIYHKFSHGAAFYTLNGKNVNVMLESVLTYMRKFQLRKDFLREQRNIQKKEHGPCSEASSVILT